MNPRKLLFPFSILYNGVTSCRNYFYDKGWKESTSYDLPVICVGNLSVGGTGKSPMIEYLIAFLKEEYQVAVLSRGYKRKSKGFKEVQITSTAEEVGDEPLQFKQKFQNVTVAVCANRREGIEKLKLKAEVILLDDAFQHRKVKSSYHILLTPYNDLFLDDMLLPAGNLRESRKGKRRADMILVTKCPDDAPYSKFQAIQYRMNLRPEQCLYFSKIGYDSLVYSKSESQYLDYFKDKTFALVTGIANPGPLVDFLKKKQFKFEHKKFPDHHHFSVSELEELNKKEIILTTEKDYMRLAPKLDKFALYYLPIKTIVLNDQDQFLKDKIKKAIVEFKN